jgi:hypothetical protein
LAVKALIKLLLQHSNIVNLIVFISLNTTNLKVNQNVEEKWEVPEGVGTEMQRMI